MKYVLLFMAMVVTTAESAFASSGWSDYKTVVEVQTGYDPTPGYTANYVQAKTSENIWYVYYANRPGCSQDILNALHAALLAAKWNGDEVRFFITTDGGNPIFGDIKFYD